jgi:protein-S-isoprenylcysteine O-methyltransferase Ste14
MGGALIYSGFLAFLSVILIFIPMMYYRANQEEKLLTSEFSEYPNYKQKTGMFFPKIFKT